MTTLPKLRRLKFETYTELYRRLRYIETFAAFLIITASTRYLVEGPWPVAVVGYGVAAGFGWLSYEDHRHYRFCAQRDKDRYPNYADGGHL